MLRNAVALVTGAGSGIGRSIADVFAREGAKVCVADISLESANAAAHAIARAHGRSASDIIGCRMDVSSEREVDEGVARVVRDLGRPTLLVANAGVQIISPIVDFSLEQWRKVTSVHLDGTFLTTRAVMREMVKAGKPQPGAPRHRILLIGSVHSKQASRNKSAYVAAKHGMLGFNKAIAVEGAAHGISSAMICPGFVLTPLVEKQIPEQAQQLKMSEADIVSKVMLKDTVNGEFASVEDIANTALFLAAHPTDALTGQSIVVSNGWSMQ